MRDQNLLPYSSRNFNLNKNDKFLASKAFSLIKNEKRKIKRLKLTKINFSKIKKNILSMGIRKIDYIEAINLNSLKKAKKYNENFNIFTAFYIGNIRLIDNF